MSTNKTRKISDYVFHGTFLIDKYSFYGCIHEPKSDTLLGIMSKEPKLLSRFYS